ncbi:DUF2330 domain-containing protein [Streptomyces sp. DH37]|uniref:DUF2330 domain-containing protein n=1 Tax=Streptomyces sp. DH37 TaxID=3040122 RepID=UPI002442C7EF|nr:DUF2330 domain-containing protein [Streptomyces sp. DH37]MDG9704911.1 DUF2330 domain-containing protein [Streptomyces sp. DH37]
MLLLVQSVWLARPAHACGCGGMVPAGGTTVSVREETSVVRWDGRTERIVMRLTVGGDASEAAWIMPVPGRATVELGDRALFDELEEVTAPVRETRRHFWPRSGDWPFDGADGAVAGAPPGGAAPPVGVVGRERLGPFDVARLTATDPGALDGWLRDNGFELPDRLARELEPYVEEEWQYVAVRLAPAREDGNEGDGKNGDTPPPVLGGALDPLSITFGSDRPVYPMRLSRAARTPQALRLYVLAPHRMEPAGPIGGERPEVLHAGRLTGAELAGRTGLRELVGEPAGGEADGEVFLTALAQDFPHPERISGDHELRRAEADTPYRAVEYDDELLTWGGVPAWIATSLAVLVLPLAAAAGLVRRGRAARGGRVGGSPPRP